MAGVPRQARPCTAVPRVPAGGTARRRRPKPLMVSPRKRRLTEDADRTGRGMARCTSLFPSANGDRRLVAGDESRVRGRAQLGGRATGRGHRTRRGLSRRGAAGSRPAAAAGLDRARTSRRCRARHVARRARDVLEGAGATIVYCETDVGHEIDQTVVPTIRNFLTQLFPDE